MRAVLLLALLASAACGGPVTPGSGDGTGGPDDVRRDAGPGGGPTVLVPAGAFMMGCNPAVVIPCDTDEMPFHSVVVSAFELDRTEVTQAAYANCVDDGRCTLPAGGWDPIDRGTFPVTHVTWYQARAYCEWNGKRLPTEAEWEMAARGPDGRLYPWGNATPTCEHANLALEGCGGMTWSAGSRPAGRSPFGADDLAGNVVEWVADWYDDGYYAEAPSVDPTGPAEGFVKVLRGGSFASETRSARTSYRGFVQPDAAPAVIGFRCARDVETAPGLP